MTQITLITAALLAIVNVWLGFRVGQVRGREKVMLGDAGNPTVLARMRAHANFSEYVPIPLILMALIETAGGARWPLAVAGIAILVARILHPFGMDRPAPNPFRMVGISVTLLVTLALAIWGLAIAYGA